VAISDGAQRNPSYAFEQSGKNRNPCESFPKILIDFRFWPHPASKPFCSIVSRQQCRRFNDLHCLTSPTAATAFDKHRRIRLKAKILLT